MSPPSPPPAAEGKNPLVAEVERLLCDSMGVRTHLLPVAAMQTPLAGALALLAIHGLVWLAVEVYALRGGWQSDPRLVSLLAWGGCYFAAAYFFARGATLKIIETVKCDIVRHASPAYLERVASDLRRRYRRSLSLGLPLLVAALSLGAAALAVAADVDSLSRRDLLSPESALCAAAYFLYFFTGAQGVVAARFYLSFADHLETETGSFYVLGAADSPLVAGLARLSSQVLIFCLMIFLIILTSMLLAAPWLGAYAFPARSWFLLLLVPVAGFFSLGFGSLVYLSSEAKIRNILRRFIQEKLAPVRHRSNDLFPDCAGDSPECRDTLEDLGRLHDRVVAGGRYGSRMGATLSLALPFALPIVSAFKLLLD